MGASSERRPFRPRNEPAKLHHIRSFGMTMRTAPHEGARSVHAARYSSAESEFTISAHLPDEAWLPEAMSCRATIVGRLHATGCTNLAPRVSCSLTKACGRSCPAEAHKPAVYVFIDSKNSPLLLVLRSLSSRKSIASIVPIGLRIRRSTYIFLSTSDGVSSSSLRVPERVMSIAGKVRLSATLRSRINSELPVPLNSSK